MKEGHLQLHTWQYNMAAAPQELWPYISDINRIFRKLGANSIKETTLSRNRPKGFLELSHDKLKSYAIWEQEPFKWEKPFRFGVNRIYKIGFLKQLKFHVELIPSGKNTRIQIKVWVKPASHFFSFFLNLYMNSIIKNRLNSYIQILNRALSNNLKPYEVNKPKTMVRGANRRLKKLTQQLYKRTKRQRIADRLIEFIRLADDEDLRSIHPYSLAEYWGEKKYSVLNVFLHAAKLNILDFSWDVSCPKCTSSNHNFRKMKDARGHLYCEDCDHEFTLDFNQNMHLVFTPNPIIRKIPDSVYCMNSPGDKTHRVLQHYLEIEETHYPQLNLEEGTYQFKTYNHEGHLTLYVREDGADNINLYFTDDHFEGQEVTVSKNPNLTISNNSSKNTLCYIEKLNWKEEAIQASEVSSSLDFKTLFAKETIKDTSKVKASNVTMLFTDIMNSTELYLEEGDELAIGRVMGHFNIIQQIVSEERGGIVKTIGDSVMAVFREPVSAIKAVHRIQKIFSTSAAAGDSFALKAGVHFGDCMAVNLNGRIDYFGTTVNLASRLVDVASEKEIMVSEAVFNHPDVKLYLDKNSDTFFVKESLKELKGFDDEEFKVKQIRLERPPMKLVI